MENLEKLVDPDGLKHTTFRLDFYLLLLVACLELLYPSSMLFFQRITYKNSNEVGELVKYKKSQISATKNTTK